MTDAQTHNDALALVMPSSARTVALLPCCRRRLPSPPPGGPGTAKSCSIRRPLASEWVAKCPPSPQRYCQDPHSLATCAAAQRLPPTNLSANARSVGRASLARLAPDASYYAQSSVRGGSGLFRTVLAQSRAATPT